VNYYEFSRRVMEAVQQVWPGASVKSCMLPYSTTGTLLYSEKPVSNLTVMKPLYFEFRCKVYGEICYVVVRETLPCTKGNGHFKMGGTPDKIIPLLKRYFQQSKQEESA
jgi:hypothetical protein